MHSAPIAARKVGLPSDLQDMLLVNANGLQTHCPTLHNLGHFLSETLFAMAAVSVYCTGFGDFQGVKGNPTAAIAAALPAFIAEAGPSSLGTFPWNLKSVMTLHVSIRGCQAALEELEAAIEAESGPCVILHLGVAAGRATASLERRAWNEATFLLPDEE